MAYGVRTAGALMLTASALALTAGAAWAGPGALPTGGRVAAGSAVIGAPSGGQITISQSSARAVLTWSDFSIGAGDGVRFNNGKGATLNRVTTANASEIDGSLTATGSVYLINPNGIVIGKGGVVNVGGSFVATTLDTADSAFMAGGSLTFSGPSTASVINLGQIGASAGDVVLAARTVENDGTLTAPNGDVGLLAGSEVTLSDALGEDGKFSVLLGGGSSATNTGSISGALAELRAYGGNVYALAGDTGGAIVATGTQSGQGKVFLVAEGGDLSVNGTITARGPGGSGGSIETSGSSVEIGAAAIDAGLGGSWLLDPNDLTISQTAANTIAATLNAGTSVTQQTTASGTGGSGDITVSPNVTLAWTTAAGLTLSAYRDIALGAGSLIKSTGGGDVTLYADNTGTGVGTVSFGASAKVSTSGAVNLFYNPSVNPANSAVNTTSYASPTETYAADVTGGANLTAYMLVNTLNGLQNIQNNLSGDYALGRDIDASASATANWNGGVGFAPIGSESTQFTGVLNGQGYVVEDLTIDRPAQDDVGLIGVEESPALIENIGVLGGSVTGASDVGGLVGYAKTSASVGFFGGVTQSSPLIVNSFATDNVASSAPEGTNIGGLVGYALADIADSYATGSVSASGEFSGAVGGLVGDDEADIIHSFATGAISTTGEHSNGVGGLVGYLESSNGHTQTTNSYATGSVNGGSGLNIGGLVGVLDTATISQSYASGSVYGAYNVGGLVGDTSFGYVIQSYALGPVNGTQGNTGGLIGAAGTTTIDQTYATGLVVSTGPANTVAGLIGYAYDADLIEGYPANIYDSYWDTQTSGQRNGVNWQDGLVGASGFVGLTTAQFSNVVNFPQFAFTTTPGAAGWVIVDADSTLNNAGGAAGATRPMLASEYSTTITNAHQLQLMAMDLGASYVLGADIDASATAGTDPSGILGAEGFAPIGGGNLEPYVGSLDGQGYQISNLVIDRPTQDDVGLFGVLSVTASVSNLALYNNDVTGQDYVGQLAGQIAGLSTAANVHQTLPPDGGGVGVGFVKGGSRVGGLVGYMDSGTLSDSSASVSVDGASEVGGLVGAIGGGVNNSSASGAVYASTDQAGGLAGSLIGEISGSFATGDVTGPNTLGGLVGRNNGLVSGSYATGAVSGAGLNNYYLGGLIGLNNGQVEQSYATGDVIGNYGSFGLGGLIGGDMDLEGGETPEVSQSYAEGVVTADTNSSDLGGLIGVMATEYGAVTQTYATGLVFAEDGSTNLGGLIGANTGVVIDGTLYRSTGITASYWDTQSSEQTTSAGGVGLTTAQFSSTAGLPGFTFTTTPGAAGWVIVDADSTLNNAGGAAGATRPMLASEYSTTIDNGHQLQLIAMNLAGHYVLANDINLLEIRGPSGVWITAEGFVPLGWGRVGGLTGAAPAFSGGLDGEGYTIDGLMVNASAVGVEHAGLFGVIAGTAASPAYVSDLTLTNATVTGTTNVGALAGRIYGDSLIDDVDVASGQAQGATSVGGLAGYLNLATVEDSQAWASVTGSAQNTGGLVGYEVGGLISSSQSYGVVKGASLVGGLVGYANGGALTGDAAYQTVTATEGDTGGLVGYDAAATIGGSSNFAAVAGPGTLGGLVGHMVGGALTNDASTGSVTGSGAASQYAGGLVGATDSGTITGSYATGAVSGANYVGGLVGDNTGTISDSFASGAVTATRYDIGGLVGENDGYILDSYASGNVSGGPGSGGLGGLVGDMTFGTVIDSWAGGSVSGGGGIGGLVGSSYLGNVIQSYALGAVTTSGSYAGGLMGSSYGDVINQTYSTGAVTSTGGGQYIAGLIGAAENGDFYTTTLLASYWDTQTSHQSVGANWVDGPEPAGASVTGLTTAQFSNSANFPGFAFTTTPGGSPPSPVTGAPEPDWVIVDQDSTLNNAGGAAGATRPMLASEYSTTITDGHQLQLIAMNLAGDYVVGNNFSLAEISSPSGVWSTGEGFAPLGWGRVGGLTGAAPAFSGELNGEDHQISNLTINASAAGLEQAGLFGVIAGGAAHEAYVTDLQLLGANITGTTNVGGLAGRVYGYSLIDDVTTLGGSVSGTTSVGGLAGYLNQGEIEDGIAFNPVNGTVQNTGGLVGYEVGGNISDSFASNVVTGAGLVGGLVGWTNGGILNGDLADVSTTATGADVGGLVGYDTGALIEASESFESVTGGGNVGGLVGHMPTGTLLDDQASSIVKGQGAASHYLGGLVGEAGGTIENSLASGAVDAKGGYLVGGLVGADEGGTISQSYANVAVAGADQVGGLAGSLVGSSVSDSYATGSVTGEGPASYDLGGLVGSADSGSGILRTYATGLLAGHSDVGGLVGDNAGTIGASYWNTQTTGQSQATGAGSGSGATGLTTAQMAQQSSYVGWDFVYTWYPPAPSTSTPPTLRTVGPP